MHTTNKRNAVITEKDEKRKDAFPNRRREMNDAFPLLIWITIGLFIITHIRVFLMYMHVSNIEKTVTQIAEKMEVAK